MFIGNGLIGGLAGSLLSIIHYYFISVGMTVCGYDWYEIQFHIETGRTYDIGICIFGKQSIFIKFPHTQSHTHTHTLQLHQSNINIIIIIHIPLVAPQSD